MKGVRNDGFEQSENISQAAVSRNFELQEHLPNNETSLGLENSRPDDEMKDNGQTVGHKNSQNAFVRANLKVRRILNDCLFGESSKTKIFWIVFFNGVNVGLLAASILRQGQNGFPEVDWCNGVGFLWISYSLLYIYLLYYQIKKYLGKAISEALKPLFKRLSSLGANKYFRLAFYSVVVLAVGLHVLLNPGKSGRRIYSFLGIIVFTIFGYIFSKHPAHINWRPVICGLGLQFLFGLLAIRWEPGRNLLDCLGGKVTSFLQYTEEGSTFMFGYLAKGTADQNPVFAFSVLPVIYFLSFIISILSYYGALQWLIMKASAIVTAVMGTTVCESVYAVASIFLGMSEAPILIREYLKDLTKSEMCAIMCAGWSTVAGVVMAAYIGFGVKASHLIAASVMSAPASLSYSKLMYPETEESKNTVHNIVLQKEEAENALDAASKGAVNGFTIVYSITANIIAFLAFIAFLDGTLNWIGMIIGFEELSIQFILSKIFYPVSFLMGVEEESLEDVAYLVGIKTVANEFQAFEKLGDYIKNNKLSERSEIIATYALCGFSNFGSVGITIGVMSAIEPQKRGVITELAVPAFVAANIVCFLTACVAGCLID